MNNYTTEELLCHIIDAASVDDIVSDYEYPDVSLSSYLNALLKEKNFTRIDVIHRADLNETFGYQIFMGQRKASRNKILQIAFAMNLSLEETQRLLCVAEVGGLYPQKRRDAIIIFCIIKEATLQEANEKLYQFEEETIV